MAPIDFVIDAFIGEEKTRLTSNCVDNIDRYVWSVRSQSQFAIMIASLSQNNDIDHVKEDEEIDWDQIHFLPSRRYVKTLVKRYAMRMEMKDAVLEDNNLASLIYYLSSVRISNIPDPASACIVTYQVPLDTKETNRDHAYKDLLKIRIYPHHNDVGVAKVWEAGAALAEYIIHNRNIVGLRVVELGAGVGMTGLVAAAFGTKSMHMTDYTESTLDNMAYNILSNKKWLQKRGVDPNIVSAVSEGVCCHQS